MRMSKERSGSLFFLFTGIYGLIFSVQLPLGKLDNPGPGMLPLALAILLFFSGILWFFHDKVTPDERVKLDWEFFKKHVTPFKIVLSTIMFVLILEPLGYLLTAFIFLLLLYFWVSRFNFWISTTLALFIGIGSWLFFGRLLSVQFPKGLLPF